MYAPGAWMLWQVVLNLFDLSLFDEHCRRLLCVSLALLPVCTSDAMQVQSESADNRNSECALFLDVAIGISIGTAKSRRKDGVICVFHLQSYMLGLGECQVFSTTMLPNGSRDILAPCSTTGTPLLRHEIGLRACSAAQTSPSFSLNCNGK